MGTDICIYAEQRQHGIWHFVGEMEEPAGEQRNSEHASPSSPKDLYDIRNYSLFAILADVRNDEGYECIGPRRGIPADLSPEIKRYFATFQSDETGAEQALQDEGAHADLLVYNSEERLRAGWLTLKELLAFDWQGKRIQRYGRVDEKVAPLFHPERGFPFHQWPQGLPCSYSRVNKGSQYCNAIWTETYAEAAGPSFMRLLDAFERQYGPSEDVRFVFWFS